MVSHTDEKRTDLIINNSYFTVIYIVFIYKFVYFCVININYYIYFHIHCHIIFTYIVLGT